MRKTQKAGYLVEKADNLACDMFSPCLLMVHNPCGGRENDVAKLTRWQELDDPFLKITELDIVAGRDDSSLVEAAERVSHGADGGVGDHNLPAVQLDDNLAIAVVVDFLELADIACIQIPVSEMLRKTKRASFSQYPVRRRVRSFAKISISRALKGRWSWKK